MIGSGFNISCVLVNDRLTEWFDVKLGVHQGDSLSPTLFLIFIDDLVELLPEANYGIEIGEERLQLMMYADDIVILNCSVERIQAQLDILSSWCLQWGMKVNLKKITSSPPLQPSTSSMSGPYYIDV